MRKTDKFVVAKEGRDKGKIFILTEMPARAAEKWAARALLALARSGIDIPKMDPSTGWAGLALAGIRALQYMEFSEAEPLMDEMMWCVQINPDPAYPHIVRPLIDKGLEGDDIEEVQTRIDLRGALFELHAGFFRSAGTSKTT